MVKHNVSNAGAGSPIIVASDMDQFMGQNCVNSAAVERGRQTHREQYHRAEPADHCWRLVGADHRLPALGAVRHRQAGPRVHPHPRRAFKGFPRTQAFGRGLTWRITEQFNKALIENTPLKAAVELGLAAQLLAQVRDPELRGKLIPD